MKSNTGKHLGILIGTTLFGLILTVSCAGSAPAPAEKTSPQPAATAPAEAPSAGQPKPAQPGAPAAAPKAETASKSEPAARNEPATKSEPVAKTEAAPKTEPAAKVDVAANPTASPKPQALLEPLQCPAPSEAFLEILVDTLTVQSQGDVKKAQVVPVKVDNTSAAWFLVGGVITGSGVPRDTVGIWATSIDPTAEKISPGMINSINDAAKQYSEWPQRDDFTARFTANNPEVLTILNCVKGAE